MELRSWVQIPLLALTRKNFLANQISVSLEPFQEPISAYSLDLIFLRKVKRSEDDPSGFGRM